MVESYRFLPTELQRELLLAATREDDRAVEAWRTWTSQADLANVDRGSMRLLPLAYANLRDRIPEDEGLRLAKATYRRTWFRCQLNFRECAASVGVLQDASIPCLVFKGAATATRYYEHPCLCPMDDIDLAVPESDALRASKLLEETGWERKDMPHQQGASPDVLMRYCHAFDLAKNGTHFLDLHWFMFSSFRVPGADCAIWDRADEVDFFGQVVRMPNLTDSLLITCFHGCKQMHSGAASTMRWCVDALRHFRAGAIDWTRFKQMAEHYQIGQPVAVALEYVRDVLSVNVPSDVLVSLRAVKMNYVRRYYLEAMMKRADYQEYWKELARATNVPHLELDANGLLPRLEHLPVRFERRYRIVRALYDVLFFKYAQEVGVALPPGLSGESLRQWVSTFGPWWENLGREWKMEGAELKRFLYAVAAGRMPIEDFEMSIDA